jgi:Ca2+-binding RTX toxin-like protein
MLPGTTLYTTTETTVTVNVTNVDQRDPDGTTGRFVFLLNHDKSANAGLFGNDVMAGGAGRDTMFGELGNDLMQGDGMIDTVVPTGAALSTTLTVTDSVPPSTGGTLYFRVPEQSTDGDDYMEGNGGSDTMYGGLGQDDMIGGSSSLYGLDPNVKQGSFLRPDSTDWMWGGAGVQVARGDQGYLLQAGGSGTDPAGLAAETPVAAERGRDADHMLGDNGNIFRIVKAGATPGTTAYVRFQYDTAAYTGGSNPLVVRSMEWLDYTLGGPDFDQNLLTAGVQTTQGGDNGAGDYIHGEAGNDVIHGMTGSDILFGDANDDDITGGYGHDWISGGTGRDGVIGDDGLIRTSLNSTTGEALFGVAGLKAVDPSTKDSNGDVLDEVIATPGTIQRAVINVTGELTKAMDLTPLSVDASWMAVDDEFGYAGQSAAGGAPYADDIIYGGLGSDWLHGGSGDDAISGAEALPVFYAAANAGAPGAGTLGGSSVDAGNQLRFNPIDLVSNHTRERAGEFALYDEYNPLRQIRVSTTDGWSGDLVASGGSDFILNFNENEGVLRASETVPTNGNNVIVTGPVFDDGDDRIFGDTGNDWIVGGTGRDDVYGGWGNDLLNVDDDQTTNGGLLNDTPDTHSTYEDRAYGGAGRDVLIANTGGDRLIDWVGEWNSYLVPFAPFGMATVSRTLQPQLPEFLYALSRADGADPTIVADGNGTALRNGEPYGELGLVLQKDAAWQDQTGAPADPQAGNIPGGKRDVLRSADFNNQQGQGFVAESGSWSIAGGKYEVAPSATSANKDAISLYFTGEPVPTYFEVAATINAIKAIGGFKANAYIIFDYVNPDNFKFAGLNISTNKIEIGQRASWGFQVLKSVNASLKAGQDYNVLLAVNGNAVTFVVDGTTSVSYAFTPRVDDQGIAHPIRDGMVGLGGDNARARIDDVRLQILPPTITYAATDGFAPTPTLLTAQAGNWVAQAGRFTGTPTAGIPAAVTSNEIAVGVSAYLQVDSTFKLVDGGATAGIVFDKYSATDFKWVGMSTGKLMIGHYTAKAGWVVDLTVLRSDIVVGSDVALSIALKGATVSVTLNGTTVASRVYNATLVDGAVGTFTRGGVASFDSFGLKTDDAKMSTALSSAATTMATTGSDGLASTAATSMTSSGTATLLAAPATADATLAKAAGTSTTTVAATSIELPTAARTDSSRDADAQAVPIDDVATAARKATSGADSATGVEAALPTIDWSQLIVVADDAQTSRRHDDAANADKSALWQEDFVVNLGKAARNPNAALRFTI